MAFKARLTRPEAGNKYYIRKENGGYSGARLGSPVDPLCNVLANCVGYAYGRFHEIAEDPTMHYFNPVHPEIMVKNGFKGLETGNIPRLGALMVWTKNSPLDTSDGTGHVEIVEQIISNDDIVTSSSGFNGPAFRTVKRHRGMDNRWGMNTSYNFVYFVYNPMVCESKKIPIMYLGSKWEVNVIVKDNENYIRLRDLDEVLSLAGVGWFENSVILNGKKLDLSKYNIITQSGTNYIRLRDLDEKLNIATVTYNEGLKMPVVVAR